LESDLSNLSLPAVQDLIRDISAQHHAAEDAFLQDVLGAIRHIDPSATTVQLFASDNSRRMRFLNWLRSREAQLWLGSAFVTRCAALLGRTPTPSEISGLAVSSEDAMRPAIAFLEAMWQRLVNNPLDASDSNGVFRNNLVDYHLLLSVGAGAEMDDGTPVLLVSSERKMRAAGGVIAPSPSVVSLNDYLASLPA
jgi:hypothetical protein